VEQAQSRQSAAFLQKCDDGQNFQVAASYGVPLKKGSLELTRIPAPQRVERTGLYTARYGPK